jgi:type IV pilus assembly protein PilE
MTKHRGFTLIELLIVVVVVAILAGIAVPSYRAYVLRSHRVEGKSALLAVATAQEKFYLQNNRYALDDERADAPPTGLGIPDDTENGWYSIEVEVDDEDDPQAWSATVTAKGDQADDTSCAEMTLTSTGSRSASSDSCWLK